MIEIINKTISEIKNSPSLDDKKVSRVKKALQSKNPDNILLALQKSGDLKKYFEYWKERSSQSQDEIKETFQDKSRPIIQVLIDQHILKSFTEPSKIVWTDPNVISSGPIRHESVGNKQPDFNSQSKTALILDVSRQLIQKHCKGRLKPAVCLEGKDKGKINLWHQCVQDYKTELEEKKKSIAGPAITPLNKYSLPGEKKTPSPQNFSTTTITFEDVENLTLKEIVIRYGNIEGFKNYVSTLDKMAAWKNKEIKYEQARKRLVAKNPMASSLFAIINTGFRKLVTEYPATVTDSLFAIAQRENNKDTARIDAIALQEKNLSAILKAVKSEVIRGLDDIGDD